MVSNLAKRDWGIGNTRKTLRDMKARVWMSTICLNGIPEEKR